MGGWDWMKWCAGQKHRSADRVAAGRGAGTMLMEHVERTALFGSLGHYHLERVNQCHW